MSRFENVPLGSVATLQAGVGFPLELQGNTSGRYPFLKVGDISRGGRSGAPVLSVGDHYVDAPTVDRLRARPIPAGSVLFAKIGEAIRQNHRVIAGCELLIDNNAMAAIPGPKTCSQYLFHYLRTVDFYAIASSTTVPALRKSELEQLEMPLPPIAEQRRIAEVLDRAEALRTKRRAALAQLDTLTQSIFLDLFGDPHSNPKNWPLKRLDSLGQVKTGGTPPSAKDGMFGGPIPFVTPGDLDCDNPVKRTVTEEGATEAEVVRAGAALVCCIGATIGKMGIAKQRSAFNQQINAVEWTGDVDDTFGIGVLRFFRQVIAQRGASTTLPILKKSSFSKIEVPVPPLRLQQDFASRIAAVEKLKSTQRASLAELDALFASLQHRAFRGEL